MWTYFVVHATAQPVALVPELMPGVGSNPDRGQLGADVPKTGADYTFFN